MVERNPKRKFVVFTDLDGTLLDAHTYSFEDARPSLELLDRHQIPLILCSSKTRAEIAHYRARLQNRHPFIAENGGGIFIPKGYFTVRPSDESVQIVDEGAYEVIPLGAPYAALCAVIEDLRTAGYAVRGFNDMTIGEVMAITGLTAREAAMAKERDFDEPFLFDGDQEALENLAKSIRSRGYALTRGRFFHIMGNSDKGRAVQILSALYRNQFGDIVTVAIGDSPNDLPMLLAVDIPMIVQKPDGSYDSGLALARITRADGIGPKGWNRAIASIL